jgi:hypothetical protein
MKRYASLDLMRGIAILGMTFVHILDDLYDYSWLDDPARIAAAPTIALLLLLFGMYFGAWAGLFLMVSATSNMVSMYRNLESGKSVGVVVKKQVIGGFILLFFAFLAEGTLQYYGLYQTIRAGAVDFSRILWKGYTMETIQTIAGCMIVNGIIQGIMSINGGHKKINRNILIYAILAIIVVGITQPIWDWVKAIIPGYPFDPYQTGRDLQYPSVNATFGEYVYKLLLLPLAGSPEPIFPFLAVSFIGSIIGLELNRPEPTRTWPRYSVYIGLLICLSGVIVGIIANVPFDSYLPLNDFSIFARIGRGLNWRWLPWICFITGGQVAFMGLIFRLVEFRGKGKKLSDKTTFIRRFGTVAFTIYTFHRTIAMIPLTILSGIFQRDMTIDVHNLNGWICIFDITICILFIHGLLVLWEKVGYVGSLEWMIGTIGAYALGIPKKSPEKKKWYQWGAIDVKNTFYNAEWINIFEEGDYGSVEHRDSKLALKLIVPGFFLFPATLTGLSIVKFVEQSGKDNPINKKAKILGYIALSVNIITLIVLYIIDLGTLGLASLL